MPDVCRTARFALLCLTLLPLASAAQVVRDTNDPLDAFAVVDPRLRPSPSGAPFDSAAADLEPGVRAGWGDFLARAGGPWKGYVDRRTGLVESAEGAGIPWIPGAGNSLGQAGQAGETGGGKPDKPDLARMEAIARAFLPRVARPLGIDPATLKLAPGRSGLIGDHLWLVDFDIRLEGLTVEGARVVFRVNNGNLIQFGTENLPSPGAAVPPQQFGRKEALDILARHLGGFTALDTFVDGGTERLLPLSLADDFKTGEGRGLVRAWEIVFRRKGSIGTWRARIDATTGDILDFQDVNAYSQANGGVYPSSYIFANETALPMPFADVSTGGFTNSAGQFPSGGSPSSTLAGQYVRIFDQCGSISQAAGGSGNIQFGTSGGTDCITPGSGGAGNTHSARTQFYHLNRIKEAGRAWLPGNTWLTSQLPAVVNINATCNAYWNGNSVNFFKSGGGCGNTGEIAAISLHEYAHGLDSNDGAGFSLDGGTGEAYADITAALVLRDSCIGPGFQGGNCGGYGDACTSCTGVRDIDWARHVSNTPHTVDNFYRPRCGFGGGGPCGGEVHCESYVATEAMWDFAARDLPNPGSAGAWGIAERLWYFSRPTATVAHTCNTNNIPWTSDGCTTGSWWRTMRAADDDDGNLANGTPHSCQLFAAFNRHGMACAADAGANVCFSACTPPAVPTVGLTAGNHQVSVSWTSSGPSASYDVFRSDAGCGSGFVKVASDVAGTAFTDTGLANGLAYSYQVVAHGLSNFACSAPASACQAATPQLPPCPGPPPAPAAPTATTQGVERIQLSWTAVAGASEYLLLRSTSPGGPFVQFRTVSAPAISYLDTGLTQNTTYYYVMRVATAENCISANSAAASATTNQCQEITLYDNSFESGSGLSDWTVASLDSSSTEFWRGIQACTAHSGSKIFRFGGDTCGGYYADAVNIVARPMGSGGIAVPAGSDLTRLSFWHRWNFESGYDGGTLRVSVDGNQYVSVPAAAIIGGSSYNGTLYGGCHPSGTYGTPTFTSFQNGFVETEVDLDQACDLASGTTGGCGGRSVRLDFAALTDCSVYYPGWFVDDVHVTTCAPHGCTGAPVIGTATTPADNQVSLTWSNGAPASTSFNVYRALGTCAAPGPFTQIATGVGASPYLDAPVSGGLTYAYRVAGLDAAGVCESDKSACVQVVPTGPCNLPPAFAGLASAGDAEVGTCALDLSWDPAVAYCGGPATYDVFRSTDPAFVPAPANRIATGLTGTSLEDSGTLEYGATYYYVVRAVDTATGIADANTVRRSAIPTGPLVMAATLPDTFEAADGFDLEGWTNTGSSTPWTWSSARWQTPGHSWYAPGRAFAAESLITSPPIRVQAGSTLTFWHTYEFEACFDGGALEVSEDGFKWASVPTFAFVSGGYTEHVYGYSNPIYGRPAWCHGTLGAMTQVQVSLALWQGKTIQVRWHSGADSSVASNGWYVDSVSFHDVVVDNGCTTEPPPAADFHTLTPCRLVDTRAANAPVLQPGELRTFQITGACGVPATAKALSVNITAVDPVAAGDMILFRSNQTPPLASSISFKAGVNRANNGMISLSPSGEISVQANTPGAVHLVLDVNGYFQEED
ncbi:MAG: hypothetical protein ACJ759_00545 [Thermoanaerobaculia bacterium]